MEIFQESSLLFPKNMNFTTGNSTWWLRSEQGEWDCPPLFEKVENIFLPSVIAGVFFNNASNILIWKPANEIRKKLYNSIPYD